MTPNLVDGSEATGKRYCRGKRDAERMTSALAGISRRFRVQVRESPPCVGKSPKLGSSMIYLPATFP